MRQRILAVLSVFAVISALIAVSVSAAGAKEEPFQDGRLMVGFQPGTSQLEKQSIALSHGATILSEFSGLNAALLAIPDGSVMSKRLEFEADPGISYAEPNYLTEATITPNDTYWSNQWALTRIQAPAGWDIYPGNFGGQGVSATGVTIAVVDTGINGHEDLNDGRAYAGANCVNSSSVCSPGNSGDDQGHGTHVSGIAAAATNNLKGVAGLSFNSRILPVKVLNSSGGGTYAAVSNGIIWAAQNGAKIINLSLGGSSFSSTLCNAVTTAVNSYASLVVAASGNDGVNGILYPAACPDALAVGSTDQSDNRSYFSNYGSQLFVGAPGSDIESTLPTCCVSLYSPTGYGSLSGTSMASPHVAALAGLIAGRLGGSSTPLQSIRIALAQGTDKVGGTAYGSDPRNLACNPACTWNQSLGYGRINALKALSYTGGPEFSLSSSPSAVSVNQGQTANYTINITRSGGFADPVSLSATGVPAGATATFTPNPATGNSSALAISTSSSTPGGTYTINISGVSGTKTRTTTAALTVVVPDFTLSASPPSRTIGQGQATDYTVAVNRVGGFSDAVTMSASGLPSGATASFSPNPATASSTVMSVSTSPSTPTGTYTITITGTNGTLTRTTTVTLTVAVPDFTLSANPSSVNISPGATASYAITINRTAGHSDPVSLSVTGLPAGATATFTPNPATGNSSVLAVATTASTPTGSYPLTITGTSGSLTRTVTATLIISTGRSVRDPYIGVTGDLFNFDCGIANIGGVCLDIMAGEKLVSATIEDAYGWRVGGFYRFLSSTSQNLGSGYFCNETGTLSIPAGANRLQIFVEEAFSTIDCNGYVGAGTYGYVSATFQ